VAKVETYYSVVNLDIPRELILNKSSGKIIAVYSIRRNNMSEELVPEEIIESRIYIIRGQKVMLDRDLAFMYGVKTHVLNQAVKRNINRFPDDFMFSLSKQEILRISQVVISSEIGGKSIKFSKSVNVFTEHGILMLSSVLKSERAVAVNIQIMRTFAKLKRMFAGYKELKEKIDDMEKKYDGQFREIFDAVKRLMEPPTEEEQKFEIGFKAKNEMRDARWEM